MDTSIHACTCESLSVSSHALSKTLSPHRSLLDGEFTIKQVLDRACDDAMGSVKNGFIGIA